MLWSTPDGNHCSRVTYGNVAYGATNQTKSGWETLLYNVQLCFVLRLRKCSSDIPFPSLVNNLITSTDVVLKLLHFNFVLHGQSCCQNNYFQYTNSMEHSNNTWQSRRGATAVLPNVTRGRGAKKCHVFLNGPWGGGSWKCHVTFF